MSSKIRHTPGPWTIGDENNQHVEICIGDAVANLDRQDRYGLHMVFSREEMRANAHLIAAAPLLVEALEAEEAWRQETDHSKSENLRVKATHLRKAALAAAKGEVTALNQGKEKE